MKCEVETSRVRLESAVGGFQYSPCPCTTLGKTGNYLGIFSEKVVLSGSVYHFSGSGLEWRERES